VPAALAVLGGVAFVAIGIAGLSVIERYLIVASLALLIFAAVGLGGWTLLAPGSRARRIYRIFHALAVLYGIVSAVALVSTIPRPLRCPDPRLVRSIITARSDSDGIFCRFRLAFGSIAPFFKICGRAILRDPRNLWDGLREGGTVTSAENSEFAVFNFSCRSN